jgi:hypothetical protein
MLCDVKRTQIHPRIRPVNREWLATVCREAGLSVSEGLDAILTESREAGVSLRVMTGQVIRP